MMYRRIVGVAVGLSAAAGTFGTWWWLVTGQNEPSSDLLIGRGLYAMCACFISSFLIWGPG